LGEGFAVKVFSRLDELAELRAEWCALYAGAPGKMAAQHPAFLDAAREVAPPGTLLAAVTVKRAGALIGLWPLSLSVSKRLGCRVASHPGIGEDQEYGGMLIAPDADPGEVIDAAIREIRKHADVVVVPHLQPHAPLLDSLRRSARAVSTSCVACYVVDLAGVGGWDAWLKTKSKNFRQNLGGQRRNLEKLGCLESVQDEPAIIPWFFREKRKWLTKSDKSSAWVSNPALGERFFDALAAQPASPLKTFALKMDGEYIAAGVCVVSERRLEYIATVYATDSQWERYSPGMLVSEDCGRWAVNNGLDLDFRFTEVPYKQRWMSRIDHFVSIRAALSLRGMIQIYANVAARPGRRVKRRADQTVRDYAAMLENRFAAQ
jgi:CelD/BcsL family acetyltransferase involved in cellulose biosynthesis